LINAIASVDTVKDPAETLGGTNGQAGGWHCDEGSDNAFRVRLRTAGTSNFCVFIVRTLAKKAGHWRKKPDIGEKSRVEMTNRLLMQP